MGKNNSKPFDPAELVNAQAVRSYELFQTEYVRACKESKKKQAKDSNNAIGTVLSRIPREAPTFALDFTGLELFATVPGCNALLATLRDQVGPRVTGLFFDGLTTLTADCIPIYCQIAALCPNLNTLSLSGSRVGPEGARLLAMAFQAGILRSVYLPSAGIGDAGVTHILAALGRLTRPLSLSLRGNGITEAGGDALINFVTAQRFIVGLDAKQNSLSAAQLTALNRALATNVTANKDALHAEIVASQDAQRKVGQQIVQNKLQAQVEKMLAAQGPQDPDALAAGEKTPPRAASPSAADAGVTVAAEVPVREEDEVIPEKPSARFRAGHAETWGRRPNMEDACLIHGNYQHGQAVLDLFGVFDGHGSRGPAVVAAKNVPEMLSANMTAVAEQNLPAKGVYQDMFSRIHNNVTFKYPDTTGTTACVVLVNGNTVDVANVGDTRAMLVRAGAPLRLTIDHRTDNPEEEQRVLSKGGNIKDKRVQGQLSVTRSLGDASVHPYITFIPYFQQIQLQEDDELLLLACDGVWDYMSEPQAAIAALAEYDPEAASARVRDLAFDLGSTDNISVLTVRLVA